MIQMHPLYQKKVEQDVYHHLIFHEADKIDRREDTNGEAKPNQVYACVAVVTACLLVTVM